MNKLLNFEDIQPEDALSDEDGMAIIMSFAKSRGDKTFTQDEASDVIAQCCAHLLMAQCVRDVIDGKRAIELIRGQVSFSRMTTEETN